MRFTSTLPGFLRGENVPSPADNAAPNSFARLAERVQSGAVTWTWPLAMCVIRLPILAGGFLMSLLIARGLGHADAAGFAQGLTRFDLPVVADAICLALLWRLTRREGIRLRDLFCWSRKHVLRDLALGVGLFLVTYIALFAVEAGIAIVAIGGNAARQEQALRGLLASGVINPLGMGWQIGMSVLIVPLTAAITEELVYRGYAQARLTALSGRPGMAVALTSLGFAVQHLAYGLTSWQAALSGVVGAGVAGLLFGALYYLTRQRLAALIALHWQIDVISIGLAPILLAMFVK